MGKRSAGGRRRGLPSCPSSGGPCRGRRGFADGGGGDAAEEEEEAHRFLSSRPPRPGGEPRRSSRCRPRPCRRQPRARRLSAARRRRDQGLRPAALQLLLLPLLLLPHWTKRRRAAKATPTMKKRRPLRSSFFSVPHRRPRRLPGAWTPACAGLGAKCPPGEAEERDGRKEKENEKEKEDKARDKCV